MNEWAWFGIVAVGVTLAAFGGFLLANRRRAEIARVTSEREGDSYPELVLGDMTESLGRGFSGSTRDREQILPELIQAGYYRPTALTEYRAVRAVLILVPLFTAASIAVLLDPAQIPYAAMFGLIFAGIGYSIPRLYVRLRAKKRAREIERGLPVFADMMSIALLAGQGLLGALVRVSNLLKGAFPRMSQDLEIVVKQSELLSLHTAFEQWATRSQLPDVRNLAVILTQSQRLGNDVTTALMEYATNLRVTARQRADAKAQRASFWMLFPTILCLWIPAGIFLIGPAFYEFAERRKAIRELNRADNDPNLNPISKGLQEKATKGKGGKQ